MRALKSAPVVFNFLLRFSTAIGSEFTLNCRTGGVGPMKFCQAIGFSVGKVPEQQNSDHVDPKTRKPGGQRTKSL